ncbi:putative licABCH operon regulator [Erysipelotrichaceae bacterium]|nr:putative licABCH operon regulator [Erysipelotrichaceae bacterium]
MNQALTKQESQLIAILAEKEVYLTSSYLAMVLAMSSKSVRKNLKALVTVEQEYGFELKMQKSKGYKLRIITPKAFIKTVERAASYDLNNVKMRAYYIIKLLLLNNFANIEISQQELADKITISLSTLKKDLQDVKMRLEHFGVEVATNNCGIYLKGTEQGIRAVMSRYYAQMQTFPENPFILGVFEGDEYQFVKRVLAKQLKIESIILSDLALDTITIHILVMLTRLKNKDFIESSVPMSRIQIPPNYLVALRRICCQYEAFFSLIINEIERKQLLANLLSCQLQAKHEHFGQNEEYLKHLIDQLLLGIWESMHIDFRHDSNLRNGLYLHIEILIHRLTFNKKIENQLLTTIKKNYPFAFQLSLVGAVLLEKELGDALSEAEIGYLAVHFGAALARQGQEKNKKCCTAIIVCGTGVATALLVKERVAEHFGKTIKIIGSFALHEIDENLIENVDVVLTTVPLPYEWANIILIKNLLNIEETQTIEKCLQKQENILVDMLQLLHPALFLHETRLRTKNQIIKEMTENARIHMNLDLQTIASVYDRERLASSEIGNLLAIPHPIYNYCEQSFISIMVLDKAVMWDEFYVQVVVMIVVNKEDIKAWEEIFLSLIRYLTHHDGITKMLETKNYNNFVQRFIRKEF